MRGMDGIGDPNLGVHDGHSRFDLTAAVCFPLRPCKHVASGSSSSRPLSFVAGYPSAFCIHRPALITMHQCHHTAKHQLCSQPVGIPIAAA